MASVNIPDCVLDRAHRVGQGKQSWNSRIDSRQMIVPFTSWKARTLIYRNRKSLINQRVYLI